MTTQEQKQEERKVDMMLLTTLLSQLNELFKDSKTDIHKVYFTVFWINKGLYRSLKKMYMPYQEVSSQYGNWISDTTIIPTLEKGGIIKKEKGSKRYYQRFVLVDKFNYKGKSAKGSEYDLITLYDEDGAYVKKYIDGKHNVIIPPRKKKNETKIKPIQIIDNKDKKLMELQDLYNELQASFNIIQQENFKLKAENGKLIEELNTSTKENKTTRTRSEMAFYSNKLKAEAELKKQQLANEKPVEESQPAVMVEEPKRYDQPCQINVDAVWGVDVDYSQRATAYDGEIDKYIATNFLDGNHIYHNIKARKIDNVPTHQSVKESQCRGLWLAIQYKINNIKKTA